jgi:hypothetical protein
MRLSQSRWTQLLAIIRQMSSSTEHQVMKSLASLAYEVRHSTSFRTMLQYLTWGERGDVFRIIEKIGKVARFYRSAITFVHTAAEFCSNSDGFTVEAVSSKLQCVNVLSLRTVDQLNKRLPTSSIKLKAHSAEAQRLLKRWKKYVVHAEMLLLLFYEEHPEISKVKNYIGISKRSCFLCASFIRFHKVFTMEGDHKQLYCLWTLPASVSFQNEAQRKRFSNALRDLCRLVEEKKAAICALSYRPFAYNTESVANFSRVSLKWPRFLDLSRTAPDLEAEVVSSFAPPSHLSEDSIGALQGDLTHTSLERDTVAEDPAFNSRFGDVVEVSETERNEPQEGDIEEKLEGEEVTVLEPVPRELEVLGVAITQQARPQRRRRRKQHRRADRHHNYHLSTMRKRAKDNRITRHRKGEVHFKTRNLPPETKIRQFNRHRDRNRPAYVAISHGTTKPRSCSVDEGEEESGCLPRAFSCLWMFSRLFQCALR